MSQEQDKAFFKNFAIILVVLGVLMAVFMILGAMFAGEESSPEEATAVAMENTAPVAKVQMAGDEPEAPAIMIAR